MDTVDNGPLREAGNRFPSTLTGSLASGSNTGPLSQATHFIRKIDKFRLEKNYRIKLANSEIVLLKMGKKGEIYTTKELREKMGLKANQKLRAAISQDGKRLVIETIPSLEEILRRKPVLTITPQEAEEISEREQKRRGAYGI